VNPIFDNVLLLVLVQENWGENAVAISCKNCTEKSVIVKMVNDDL
jgi:hypothetical protein